MNGLIEEQSGTNPNTSRDLTILYEESFKADLRQGEVVKRI